ncbi:hypothetical protein [Rathayibacter sp. VKM Ac-2630]|uniref:hypothetical protein n=1 Tax=Rathayibacter sp. VKM Ac-2630 TaxID=1938617 RepID=UPI000982461D|nr:hypothetical protein [Rathayibacter sp. VKM Ac-2630]OOB90279.1 hypothetical protein B0T42_12315 [Rathayibacter sp. VKM Ac-2630]
MIQKYLAALLPGFILIFGALQTALADERIDDVEAGQLLALVAGAITTFGVPLLKGRWAGGLKTGAAILASVATLIIPLVLGFTWQSLVIAILAALSALATEIGVQVREDGQRQGRHEAEPVTINVTAAPGTSESALAAAVVRSQKERDALGARR